MDVAYQRQFPGLYTMPSGCDEYIKPFLFKCVVEAPVLEDMRAKASADAWQRLMLVPLSEAWQVTADVKTLAALLLYTNLQAEGYTMSTVSTL